MHMSSRVLLVLAAGATIVGGWWILLAINDVAVALLYSALWTIAVLVAARTLLALGFGYNRLTAREPPRPITRAQYNVADLRDLRDRGVISNETYDREHARSAGSDRRTR
jgi:hypothetical protein